MALISIHHIDYPATSFPPWTVRHVSSATIKFSSGRANRVMMAGARDVSERAAGWHDHIAVVKAP